MARAPRFALFLALLLGAWASAHAGTIAWRGGNVELRADGEALPAFLLRLFAKQQIAALVSPAVGEAKVSGQFNKPGVVLLNELAATYGLVWYSFAGTVYVTSLAENQARLIAIDANAGPKLNGVLQELGVYDDRFVVKYSRASGFVAVSGPPKFLELVEQAVRYFDEGTASTSLGQVRVYRLKHAWADDRTVSVASTDTLIPGIASLLRSMLTEPANAAPPASVRAAPRTAERMPGARGTSGGNPAAAGAAPGLGLSGFSALAGRPLTLNNSGAAAPQKGNESNGANARTAAEPITGSVRADARLNAVIVRDLAERLPLYDELVRQLDQPSPLVEIEATVIDLSSGESSSLGLDYTALLSSRSERVTAPLISVTGDALAAGTAPLASIVLGANRAFLLARINALATDGKASINLRPRVVTLDNVEAVLQSTREFYVRVTGQYAGDLFKVEAGLTLRVTPSVVIDGASVQYKLLVRIDDGSVSTSSLVDGLPSVSRSSISASVTIGEGESLFIGGLISETSSAGSAGVPFLSKVPVLGALFGTRSSEVRKSERMFLITPKLVRPI